MTIDNNNRDSNFDFRMTANGEILIRLREPLEFSEFTVPAGFVSDGASIPRIGWTLIGHPFDYNYLMEAIGHDFLYQTQTLMTRKESDQWFYRKLHVKPWLRVRSRIIYRALRLFGWIAWNQHRKELGKGK